MSYFKLIYAFLFLPIVVLIYNIIPKKFRYLVLLLASLGFFYSISHKLIIFILFSILTFYLGGRLLDKLERKKEELLQAAEKEDKKRLKESFKRKKKFTLFIFIIANISILFFFKYLKFFLTNTNYILDWLNIEYNFKIIKHIAPIGISYYTLQAISYLIDVYHGKINPEKNIAKFALYLTFFPTIIEGPITRFTDVSQNLFAGNKTEYKNLCFGYQRIVFGFFKKLVIADRLNILVKTVFKNYALYSGISNWLAVIGYTIMLYAEFSGTMDIVIGSGEIFGIKLPENFKQPFFAKNISEFWTRWHITLGSWFKDYIFYPVSLSKPLKKLTSGARKIIGNRFGPLISGSIALLSVWLLNGLWHGAGWNYIFFGLYHFTMILLGNIFEPAVTKICASLHIDRKNRIYKIFQSIKLAFVVFIGELFFKAPTITLGFKMLKNMFTNFTFSTTEILNLGLDIQDWIILFIALIILLIVGLMREKGIDIRQKISEKKIYIRWPIYYVIILSIIIFGAYGPGYEPVDPIYADF